MTTEIATLAGGCFWCLEAVYDELKGVSAVASGYMGGRTSNPTYEQICEGDSGHAEVVQITYDPAVISFRDLLDVFFVIHDPTTLNRQGNDVGTQYRSAIFTHSEAQKLQAEDAMKAVNEAGTWGAAAVTEIKPAVHFWPAEKYHQDYYVNNPRQPYCMFVVAPKVAKARKEFTAKLRK